MTAHSTRHDSQRRARIRDQFARRGRADALHALLAARIVAPQHAMDAARLLDVSAEDMHAARRRATTGDPT